MDFISSALPEPSASAESFVSMARLERIRLVDKLSRDVMDLKQSLVVGPKMDEKPWVDAREAHIARLEALLVELQPPATTQSA